MRAPNPSTTLLLQAVEIMRKNIRKTIRRATCNQVLLSRSAFELQDPNNHNLHRRRECGLLAVSDQQNLTQLPL